VRVFAALLIDRRDRHRTATGCRNPRKTGSQRGRKNDLTALAPGAASAYGRITECERRTSSDIELLEFPDSEESHEAAFGRPERVVRSLSANQQARGCGVQIAYPELDLSTGRGGEDQMVSVG